MTSIKTTKSTARCDAPTPGKARRGLTWCTRGAWAAFDSHSVLSLVPLVSLLASVAWYRGQVRREEQDRVDELTHAESLCCHVMSRLHTLEASESSVAALNATYRFSFLFFFLSLSLWQSGWNHRVRCQGPRRFNKSFI